MAHILIKESVWPLSFKTLKVFDLGAQNVHKKSILENFRLGAQNVHKNSILEIFGWEPKTFINPPSFTTFRYFIPREFIKSATNFWHCYYVNIVE